MSVLAYPTLFISLELQRGGKACYKEGKSKKSEWVEQEMDGILSSLPGRKTGKEAGPVFCGKRQARRALFFNLVL